MKYRKKPIVIDAMLWTGEEASYADVSRFMGGRELNLNSEGIGTIVVHTLEGRMVANKGDWIIKDIRGEFHPCKPDIFELTYEPSEAMSNTEQVREQIAKKLAFINLADATTDTSEKVWDWCIQNKFDQEYYDVAVAILAIPGVWVEAADQDLPEIPEFQYDQPEDIPLLRRGAINYSHLLVDWRRVEPK